jgi:transglutaminase-like putative cysteine protease
MRKYDQVGTLLFIKASMIASLIFTPFLVFANEEEYADISFRLEYFNIHYVVNDDLTHSVHYERATKVLKERAIKSVKKFTTSYSASIQDIEVLEAYTKKANGRRIDTPKTNFQKNTNSGKDNNGPVFSDRTSLTVVFPEVQVGDTVVFSYKILQTEPMFPGHFTALYTFSTNYAYDDVNVTLDVPESLVADYQIRGMSEKISVNNGRKVYKWAYKNPKPKKNKRKNYSVWDPETYPGFSYSTFSSYEQIAKTYADRALPKAKVTELVRKLAKKIVGDEIESRKKARLLYEWVAINITYAGNCIGVGAVVPHDISFILDNRMGDCKDQATLLQALLSAEGIRSIQALINSGSIYTLPVIPTVTAVNHVINYLPDFDMFVDATSESIPFGMLSFSVQDKPVLLVKEFKKGTKTKKSTGKNNSQTMTSIIDIDESGSSTGNIIIDLYGLGAASARRGFRNSSSDSEEEWLKKIFTNDGHVGFGSIEKDDPKALLNTFKYKVDFKKKNLIPLYGIGAFHVAPLLPSNSPISTYLNLPGEIETVDVACEGGSSKEEYVYKLPDNIEIIATPDNMDVSGDFISYKSTYKVEGNILTVSRTFNESTPGNICSPDFLKKERELIKKVIWDIKSQVVYKVAS